MPYPLGVSRAADGALNFALYSKHATSVRLLLFDEPGQAQPRADLALDPLHHKSGRVWHCRVERAALGLARYYAYVVDGPQPGGPYELHAFDPERRLLDPYARAIVFPDGFDRRLATAGRRNAGASPLGVIEPAPGEFDWGRDRRPRHEADAVIYELHVRGFTRHPSAAVSPGAQGTFAGVIEKIPYLRELGVTIVELMPVFQADPQSGDYWGYMPMSLFAPHRAYAADPGDAVTGFRRMVKALHDADIEVILDVVYSHTAEEGADGPIYSYKGIDQSTYYLMTSDAPPRYADFSGTGNSLNCSNRYVRKMILDSMRYWVRDMHVDGFRFDLASVFSRSSDGSINTEDPPIFGDITSDPDFDDVRMIAEPWDAAGAYELGRAFPGITWLQWNDRFRDDVRRFVRGDAGMVGALIQRLYGSDDVFPDDPMNSYHAYQSVNFVTCHDGFTLHDLVAYERKRNAANGQGGRDGPAENFSWNCGHEGEGAGPEVEALRERQAKNFVALLLVSNGTPMLRAGDEMLQTQLGNNNPYNQDTETSWLDWRGRDAHGGFFRFVQQMIGFRKAHPSLGRSRFWRDEVRWFGARGPAELGPEARSLALCLRGASQRDDDLYIMINASADDLVFELQDLGAAPWRRAIDTARPSPEDICGAERQVALGAPRCTVAARSVVVLIRPSPAVAA